MVKTSQDSVLVISRADDTHVPYVQKHLSLPMVVMDPTRIVDGEALSYEYADGQLIIRWQGQELRNIRSVWYRKPQPVWGDLLPVDKRYWHYCETAILTHARELYTLFDEAFWLSDYYAIRRADFKSYQLVVASKLGFNIPDTLTTSSEAEAKMFIKHHGNVIVKSLATVFPSAESGNPTMFYSKKVSADAIPDFSKLHLAPAILQRIVEHDHDIRITVVGDQVFGAKIKASGIDSDPQIRDWRPAYFYGELDMEYMEVPDKLKRQCIELVKQLGLHYGAIDFVCDIKGAYWFLECNPNGEWAFIEHYTKQPVSKAVAVLLERGKRS